MLPITIVITEGYSDWEIAPLSGLGRAFLGAPIHFASPEGGALRSAAGLHIADTARFQAPDRGVVVVCGGPALEQGESVALTRQLQAAHAQGCIIAGICGGTLALAHAGLLSIRRMLPGILISMRQPTLERFAMSISLRPYVMARSLPLLHLHLPALL